MALQVEVSVEHFGAMRALKPLYSAMDFNMFVQVGSLSEAEFAVREGALVGALVSVDAQVVEEIVPLAEMFPALLVVTLQDLYVPLGLRILEGEYSELFRVRNMLFDLDGLKVEGVSGFDQYGHVSRNVFEGIAVLNQTNSGLILVGGFALVKH